MTSSENVESLIARLRPLSEARKTIELERKLGEQETLLTHQPEILAALSAPIVAPPAEASGDRSSDSLAQVLATALQVAPAERPGQSLGAYTLLQKIGEGGFSTVWLAEQSEPIRRKVAVKIIKRGMDTEEVISRFEVERQALALMDHPNIARVLDAGATESGRPYFVMELVRGVPITRYCDENRLPPEARLRLFISVCQAVQHAHQKGVLHRDLKPSNILVTLYDGQPVPKIIDFGIAKAAGLHLSEKTYVTQFHAFLGTPTYSSPEQMEMSALDVDTRSDIYSLGVLLYELLCGRLPFDAEALAQSGLEGMRRMICEVEPPRPSHRLATLSQDDRTTLAQQRNSDAAKLSLLLRGDLDWIVMRCLEKDRRRRYDTVTGLAADIERHLTNQPITARPPSQWYRLQKSFHRHRFAYVAIAAIALALVAGTGVSTWQAIRATRAEHEQSRLKVAETALRQQAEELALTLRYRAYASDLNGVQEALATDNLGRALNLLNRQRPKPGEPDLRGWEWRYLWQFCRSDSTTILNDKPVLASQLAVSYDGKWLAIVSHEEVTIDLWDLHTRAPRSVPIPSNAASVAIACSPIEPLLAIGLTYASSIPAGPPAAQLILWNIATRQTVREWTFPLARSESISKIVFSADGTKLLTEAGRTPVVWSVADGQRLFSLRNPQLDYMAMTPDFGLAAIPGVDGDDRSIRLINTQTGQTHIITQAAIEYINAIAFSPDGMVLATSGGGGESSIRLWDAATGSALGLLEGHHESVQRFVFSADGKTLLSGAHDSTIRVWDLASRRLQRTLRGHQAGLFDLALLPDDRTLVSSAHDGTVRLWDTRIAEVSDAFMQLEAKAVRWRFSPDSRSIITLSGDGTLQRWQGYAFGDHTVLANIGKVGWGHPIHACFASDRPLLAILKQDDTVQVWNWEKNSLVQQIATSHRPEIAVSCVAFVDNDRKLLVNWVRTDGKSFGLQEWDLADGKPARSWPYSGTPPFAGADYMPASLVSDDGRWCLVGWLGDAWSGRVSDKGPVWLIDRASGVERKLPSAVFWRGESAGFSADARQLVVPFGPATTIWNVPSGRLLKTLSGSYSAAFSPDGGRLAFGNGVLCDTQSWEQVLNLGVRAATIVGVAFSPDGNILTGCTNFGVLHLWRAPSWAEIQVAEKAPDKL